MSGPTSNYLLEYAKSGRSTCKGCNYPIAHNALRLSVQSNTQPAEGAKDHRRFTNNRHIECLTKTVVNNGNQAHGSVASWPGLNDLQPADKDRVFRIVDEVLAGTWVLPEKGPSPIKGKGKRKSDEYDEEGGKDVDVHAGDTPKKKAARKSPAKKGGKKKGAASNDDEDDY
ncbi:hypothetical protein HYH02_006464 [Chlamydomonas schloesseri]|uniref:PARP-type domain-containing protein n=1 Tax=Chlamydomonas schloesseri TaxID=2026947 RepID=A0A835WJ34_9CHLO|nr:hypothetical protein HYH02_006464 [Chlamydomonas schloesseri]|eukprot:KAG2448573.1 hypothetical protein HYH02_006464 [Chlamydomonas schloesseri]